MMYKIWGDLTRDQASKSFMKEFRPHVLPSSVFVYADSQVLVLCSVARHFHRKLLETQDSRFELHAILPHYISCPLEISRASDR